MKGLLLAVIIHRKIIIHISHRCFGLSYYV